MLSQTLLLAVWFAQGVYGDASTYQQNAECTNDQLMRLYNSDAGLWLDNDGNAFWWQSANMLTAFNDLARIDSGVAQAYSYIWETTFANAPAHNPSPSVTKRRRSDGVWISEKKYTKPTPEEISRRKLLRRDGDVGFINDFYDDEAWWALAWLGALDNTGNSDYLNEAIYIWNDMEAAWDTPACGALPWNKTEGSGPLAIQNELFIHLSASIANRVGMDVKQTYIDAAEKAWDWFANSGLINQDNLINDGVDPTTCENNGNPTYTYNQGVILGGLVELWRATGSHNTSLLDAAAAIADAVTTPGSSMLDDQDILVDECDLNQDCSGDGVQFKGVFPRNLQMLQAVRPSDQYVSFLETNAQSIWNNNLYMEEDAAGSGQTGCVTGVYWNGPATGEDASSQSSSLDCLNAAMAVTM